MSSAGSDIVDLCAANVAEVEKRGLAVPKYDRTNLSTGIVHLGVGGFHRSHMSMYIDKLMNQGNGEALKWGILGVGLMEGDTILSNNFNKQNCLYSLSTSGNGKTEDRVIGVHTAHLMTTTMHKEVLAALASESTKIVSITVTEKGYCFDSVTGKLDFKHPAIKAELEGGRASTALGYILQGLELRRQRNIAPFTVMSCDNLPMNGDKAKRLILEYAMALKPELAKWIEDHVTFPNSMVDRITPLPGPEAAYRMLERYRVVDNCPVISEDFAQWVLEDKFVNKERPRLEDAGVLLVKDVKPYELMKLRLLNGSHSALSYMSYLLGHRDVNEAMADPLVHAFVKAYMAEVVPSVPKVPGVDLKQYQAVLLTRFANPAIKDKVTRLCQDGSVKMAGFTVPAILDLFKNNQPLPITSLAIAAWIRFCAGTDDNGLPIPLDDPRGNELHTLALAAVKMGHDSTGAEFVRHFLLAAMGPVVGMHNGFVTDVHTWLDLLVHDGAHKTMQAAVGQKVAKSKL